MPIYMKTIYNTTVLGAHSSTIHPFLYFGLVFHLFLWCIWLSLSSGNRSLLLFVLSTAKGQLAKTPEVFFTSIHSHPLSTPSPYPSKCVYITDIIHFSLSDNDPSRLVFLSNWARWTRGKETHVLACICSRFVVRNFSAKYSDLLNNLQLNDLVRRLNEYFFLAFNVAWKTRSVPVVSHSPWSSMKRHRSSADGKETNLRRISYVSNSPWICTTINLRKTDLISVGWLQPKYKV